MKDNNKKYDRQLRLWGENGQHKLASCRAILFNSIASVGTETLKNLILPGIGSFHIIDERIDESSSHSIVSTSPSFFIPNKSSSDRTSKACELLCELNEDVTGSYETCSKFHDLNYNDILDTQCKKSKGLLVLAADLDLVSILQLSKVCYSRDIPLINIKCYGLIGSCRIQCRSHVVVESMPDHSIPDLRLVSDNTKLFPELQRILDSTNLDSMNDQDHGRVPYVIILMKVLQKWREIKKENYPKTFDEKNEFKDMVKKMSRDYNKEINFQEAFQNAYLAYTKHDLPLDVVQLLQPHSLKTSFDVMVEALLLFLKDNNNQPPLNGSIPDMTSSTEQFIQLQEAYQSKASQDFNSLLLIITTLQSNKNVPSVSNDELALFCKNVYNLQKISTTSFENEICNQLNESAVSSLSLKPSTCDKYADILNEIASTCEEVLFEMDEPQHTPLLWYLAQRACEVFHYQHNAYPGKDSRPLALQSDVDSLHRIITSIIDKMKLNNVSLIQKHLIESKDILSEMVRFFNADIYSISSLIGGVASQEAVKIITQKYVPVDDLYVYNGVTSVGGVYRV